MNETTTKRKTDKPTKREILDRIDFMRDMLLKRESSCIPTAVDNFAELKDLVRRSSVK